MDVEVNAQFTGSVRNRLPTGLSQSHRLPLKLGCVDLLHLLHDPFPPSGRVYSKISLLHKFGVRSVSDASNWWSCADRDGLSRLSLSPDHCSAAADLTPSRNGPGQFSQQQY